MIITAKFAPPKWGDFRTGCAPSRFKVPPIKPVIKVDGRFIDSYQDIEGKLIIYRFFLSDGDSGWCRFVNMKGDLIEGRFVCKEGALCLI